MVLVVVVAAVVDLSGWNVGHSDASVPTIPRITAFAAVCLYGVVVPVGH